MRQSVLSCVATLAALTPAFSQAVAPAPTPPAFSVEALGWLAGAWTTREGPEIEEHWMAPKAGAMLGMSRTVVRGRMAAFEFLCIEVKDGRIAYVASPGGRPPTRFTLVRASPTEAVFENLSHDFPKRILYRLQPDGSLLARIEGDGSEKEKPMEFRYVRVKP